MTNYVCDNIGNRNLWDPMKNYYAEYDDVELFVVTFLEPKFLVENA